MTRTQNTTRHCKNNRHHGVRSSHRVAALTLATLIALPAGTLAQEPSTRATQPDTGTKAFAARFPTRFDRPRPADTPETETAEVPTRGPVATPTQAPSTSVPGTGRTVPSRTDTAGTRDASPATTDSPAAATGFPATVKGDGFTRRTDRPTTPVTERHETPTTVTTPPAVSTTPDPPPVASTPPSRPDVRPSGDSPVVRVEPTPAPAVITETPAETAETTRTEATPAPVNQPSPAPLATSSPDEGALETPPPHVATDRPTPINTSVLSYSEAQQWAAEQARIRHQGNRQETEDQATAAIDRYSPPAPVYSATVTADVRGAEQYRRDGLIQDLSATIGAGYQSLPPGLAHKRRTVCSGMGGLPAMCKEDLNTGRSSSPSPTSAPVTATGTGKPAADSFAAEEEDDDDISEDGDADPYTVTDPAFANDSPDDIVGEDEEDDKAEKPYVSDDLTTGLWPEELADLGLNPDGTSMGGGDDDSGGTNAPTPAPSAGGQTPDDSTSQAEDEEVVAPEPSAIQDRAQQIKDLVAKGHNIGKAYYELFANGTGNWEDLPESHRKRHEGRAQSILRLAEVHDAQDRQTLTESAAEHMSTSPEAPASQLPAPQTPTEADHSTVPAVTTPSNAQVSAATSSDAVPPRVPRWVLRDPDSPYLNDPVAKIGIPPTMLRDDHSRTIGTRDHDGLTLTIPIGTSEEWQMALPYGYLRRNDPDEYRKVIQGLQMPGQELFTFTGPDGLPIYHVDENVIRVQVPADDPRIDDIESLAVGTANGQFNWGEFAWALTQAGLSDHPAFAAHDKELTAKFAGASSMAHAGNYVTGTAKEREELNMLLMSLEPNGTEMGRQPVPGVGRGGRTSGRRPARQRRSVDTDTTPTQTNRHNDASSNRNNGDQSSQSSRRRYDPENSNTVSTSDPNYNDLGDTQVMPQGHNDGITQVVNGGGSRQPRRPFAGNPDAFSASDWRRLQELDVRAKGSRPRANPGDSHLRGPGLTNDDMRWIQGQLEANPDYFDVLQNNLSPDFDVPTLRDAFTNGGTVPNF